MEKLNPNNSEPFAELNPALNAAPESLRHVHLMGICGTGMASLAGLLKEKGYEVRGSDQNVYPPMSDFLAGLSIPILQGYNAQNLNPRPDLVIVGNVITKKNPEAVELARLGIPYLSLPQALRHFAMGEKRSIVVAGTHGKTTTSSLTAWVLEQAGMDPGFMIGGIPVNFQANFKTGNGSYFVIEGDEYDTAFFDKGPKFLHYAPFVAILTSIEFDHADIYQDLDQIIANFRRLIKLIPPNGLLIANADDPLVVAEAKQSKAQVITYGYGEEAQVRALDVSIRNGLSHVRISCQDKDFSEVATPLYGHHNISNLLSVIALAEYLKIKPDSLSAALKDFKGVRRRQEIKGEKQGILILEDFAHHPTSVKKTIEAVHERYNGRRLIAVFEPRSNSSRRNIFQEDYASSFDQADLILLPEPPPIGNIPPEDRFSSARLIEDLRNRGQTASSFPDTQHLLEGILGNVKKGDVVLLMSNGSFDNLPDRLLKGLDNL
jgi:UDP-N-acetylmuramate: L-alanyl-gamma-D-glutamyl-meso-diaminopimelate ligase